MADQPGGGTFNVTRNTPALQVRGGGVPIEPPRGTTKVGMTLHGSDGNGKTRAVQVTPQGAIKLAGSFPAGTTGVLTKPNELKIYIDKGAITTVIPLSNEGVFAWTWEPFINPESFTP